MMKRLLTISVAAWALILIFGLPALAVDYYGTPDNDLMQGTDNNDRFWAYAGNDYVQARGGQDEARMATGNDTARGEGGSDPFIDGGNSGTGTCCYDDLRGGLGPDAIFDTGTGGDKEYLCGGEDDDQLWANDGDTLDWLTGGLGNDILHYDNNESHVSGGNETCPP